MKETDLATDTVKSVLSDVPRQSHPPSAGVILPSVTGHTAIGNVTAHRVDSRDLVQGTDTRAGAEQVKDVTFDAPRTPADGVDSACKN